MNIKKAQASRWIFCLTILLFAVASPNLIASFGKTQDTTKLSEYKLDNGHTSVVFAVSHFGLSYTYGRFNKCEGKFALDGGDLSSDGFEFKIDAKSIDTNNAERDKHLRGPEFFDTQQFPDIKFVTAKVEKVDGGYKIKGAITILGKTQPLTMPVRVVGIGKGPFGKQRAGFFTKFTIRRSDFGMDKMAGQIGDNISVTFSFEGIRE